MSRVRCASARCAACVAVSCSVLQSVVVRAGLSTLFAPCLRRASARCVADVLLAGFCVSVCLCLSVVPVKGDESSFAVCCPVLQSVAVCCSLVQSGAVFVTFQKRRHRTLPRSASASASAAIYTATHCNTLQHRLTLHVRLRLRR